MDTVHIAGVVVFGPTTLMAGQLSVRELVKLRRRQRCGLWRAMLGPAARQFRDWLLLTWIGVFFLAVLWGIFAVSCSAGSIMCIVLAWDMWLTIWAWRQSRARPSVTNPGGGQWIS